MAALAETIRLMHRHRLRHRGLYAKHLFLRLGASGPSGDTDGVDVRIIDLETVRWHGWRGYLMSRDLSTLERSCAGARRGDRVRFYRADQGLARLRDSPGLWRAIVRRSARRRGP